MRVVVVGAGIAGLAAARFVADAGLDVLVLEGSPEIGGKLRLGEVAGVPVDLGAESMLALRPEGVGLARAVGLDDQLAAPLTISASVRVGGALHPLPRRTLLGIPADLDAARASGALSATALAAIADEPTGPPLDPLDHDVAVGGLVRSRLGHEVADRLVEPLLGGVYAGRADDLSLRATMPALASRLERGGSLVRAAAEITDVGTHDPDAGAVFASLRGGLGRLPAEVASGLAVRTRTTVRSITRTGTGFALECGPAPLSELVEADAVIVAIPAAKAARLLRDVAPAAAVELGEIDSASVAVATFAFDGVSLPPGSGLLVGAREGLSVKAVTISSQKWAIESGGLTLLRASVGRAGEAEVLQREDAELIALVRRDLRALLGLTAQPVDALVTRWGGGLPQYAVGHVERVARIRDAVAAVDGLAVCGAAYDGVGIPACIASARRAADRVFNSVGRRGE